MHGIVSFNGRGFDMPLINNRFVLAAMPPPLAGAPHLDLLPPARRLWKARWGSCSLGNLERNVLGFQRTAEDVPGYLIPDIYRQYYLTGVATEMLAHVFYHNLEDIASMVVLGARMARFFRPEGLAEYLAEAASAGGVEPGPLLRRAGLGRGGHRRLSRRVCSARTGGPRSGPTPPRARIPLQTAGAA